MQYNYIKTLSAFYQIQIVTCFYKNKFLYTFDFKFVLILRAIFSSSEFFGMTTSSSGNIFRVTGPLWREFTDHRWIPPTEASDADL